jgi:AGZA family xanthine/uracil permease-like MFS transporter
VLDAPDSFARWPHSGDFSTMGDAVGSHGDALTLALVPVIFSLFMTDFFDTVGTAYAVTSAGGLLDENGEVPRIRPLLLTDSAAAAGGGVLGVSSVTTYVESGAGVAEGARTGLASVVTAGLFALTIFFVPILGLVGQGVAVGKDTVIHPAVAPALVMVGYLMIQLVRGIEWDQPEDAIPAFLVIAGIPLTFSIAAGIGFGVLGYVIAMIARGRIREIHPIMWALVPLFIAFFQAGWLESHVF